MNPDLLLARLLYRDGLMLIVDKPAGLPVHAGPGGGPNVEQFLDALRFGLPAPPALAHRLDRDTSGCLVLGRHKKALRRLGRLFSAGRVGKSYWAVVRGMPPKPDGAIDRPLRKRTQKRGWRMEVSDDGQPALTRYRVRGDDGKHTWLELTPKTGRTHQIRVHCADLGCPVVGDPAYGPQPADGPMLLHARTVTLPLYPSRPPVGATAPVPEPMCEVLLACGFDPAADDGLGPWRNIPGLSPVLANGRAAGNNNTKGHRRSRRRRRGR